MLIRAKTNHTTWERRKIKCTIYQQCTSLRKTEWIERLGAEIVFVDEEAMIQNSFCPRVIPTRSTGYRSRLDKEPKLPTRRNLLFILCDLKGDRVLSIVQGHPLSIRGLDLQMGKLQFQLVGSLASYFSSSQYDRLQGRTLSRDVLDTLPGYLSTSTQNQGLQPLTPLQQRNHTLVVDLGASKES